MNDEEKALLIAYLVDSGELDTDSDLFYWPIVPEKRQARQQGKILGPPRKFTDGQVEAIRRRIASDFECSASTVLRALRREGAVP